MAVKKFGNGGVVGAVVVDGYDDVSDGDGDQGSLVRGATAIESDGLMAKDRTATYEMGLQRIRCREHVANFIFTLLLLLLNIIITRPKPAYGRQGLDWIVGLGYSFVVFSTNKTMKPP